MASSLPSALPEGGCHGSFLKQQYPSEGAICYSEGIEGWWRTDCEHIPSYVKKCHGFEIALAKPLNIKGLAEADSFLKGKLTNQGWTGPDCTCMKDRDARKIASGKKSLFGF